MIGTTFAMLLSVAEILTTGLCFHMLSPELGGNVAPRFPLPPPTRTTACFPAGVQSVLLAGCLLAEA